MRPNPPPHPLAIPKGLGSQHRQVGGLREQHDDDASMSSNVYRKPYFPLPYYMSFLWEFWPFLYLASWMLPQAAFQPEMHCAAR